MDLLVVGGSGLLGRELTRQALAAGARVTATAHRNPAPAAAHERRRPAEAPSRTADALSPPAEAPSRTAEAPSRAAEALSPTAEAPSRTAEATWLTLDIRQRDVVEALFADVRPAVVVNAAYRQDDWATTADGGMHVAAAAAAIGARLVHVSSDAVFSGRADRYAETARPDPVTPYGAAKAAAETAVKGLDPSAIIARTSLIIGDGDSPQEALIHRLAASATDSATDSATGGTTDSATHSITGGVLFTDDVRCPIHVTDLAAALLELAASPYAGIHHLAGADAISRHELGLLVARRDGLDGTRLPAGLRANSGLPGALAVRLDTTMTTSRLTARLRGAREFLAALPAREALQAGEARPAQDAPVRRNDANTTSPACSKPSRS